MILTLTLPILERITNKMIALDPMALAKLAKLNGQVIAVNCSDWGFEFYLIISEMGVEFEPSWAGEANTTINSTLHNFLQLLTKGADTAALFSHPVDVVGNMQNVSTLRDVFLHIDIDWEEELSAHLGDALAHKIFFRTGKSIQNSKKMCGKVKSNIQEYLHFEVKMLPTKQQLNKFYDDLTTLQYDVDRAQARLTRLIENKESK